MQYKGMLLSSENGNSSERDCNTPPSGSPTVFYRAKKLFLKKLFKNTEAFRVSLESTCTCKVQDM